MPVRQQDQDHAEPESNRADPSADALPTAARRTRSRQAVIDDPPLPPPTAIRGWYRRVGTSIALLGAALIGGLMWYYGGICSLDYLGDTFAVIATFIRNTTWWQHWWIPLVISAIEIFLWPRRERRWAIFLLRLVLWLAVLAFDVFTTGRGLLAIIQPQIVIADATVQRWLSIGLSGGLGFAFAYLPEKIARWVLSDLWNLWLTPVWRWVRRSRPRPAPQSA
jgi:hypothetical protein